jgi:putative solute:sodium symporter small subunit
MAVRKTITHEVYWRKQRQRIIGLLIVWFVAGYGMSIFGIEFLNGFTLGGFPVGFWMAQQGSIFIFVLLILIYAIAAGRLDREADVEETDETASAAGSGH